MALHCLAPFCFSKIRPGRTPVLGLLNAILAATPGRIFEKQNGSGNGHPTATKIIEFITLHHTIYQSADLLVCTFINKD